MQNAFSYQILSRPSHKVAPELNNDNVLENPVVDDPKIDIPSKLMSKKTQQIKNREKKSIENQPHPEKNKYHSKRNSPEYSR